MANRLARESSPYLLQHAENPVDWHPWGEEAFALARETDRPIFLSVGYSTCHWCHVMEHESFESEEIARVLNADFVPIKVDREERPDVDRVYMAFVQATTGAGGWPMSVWLTPDLEPFYGGTYFPPTSRWGRPGFLDVLQEVARLWRDERPRIVESARLVTTRLRAAADPLTRRTLLGNEMQSAATAVPEADTLADAHSAFRQIFDSRFGGFGDAPKFPRPSELFFLLREYARTGETDLRGMSLETLRAMALGGMRDHVGGGFHRYSVDARWRVPHFEKMLYDQGQLALAYLEGAQLSGERFYATVAEDTLDYVARDLSHDAGGFYSAEDADSVPAEDVAAPASSDALPGHPSKGHVKKEGAFYVWSQDEVDALLGEDARIVRLRYGIEPQGNAPFDPQNEFGTKNLLYTAATLEEIAIRTDRDVEAIVATLGKARRTLFDARQSRPRPHLDDKIVTAWNGLAIAAFARAGRVLPAFGGDGAATLARAERAAAFLRDHLWDEPSRTLLRTWRDGRPGGEGYCEDYASLIWGLLELVQASGRAEWLEWALALQRRQDALFWDEGESGWYSTTGRDASVLVRLKEEHDGAEPSGSAISVGNLLVMSHLVGTEGTGWEAKIERTLAHYTAGPRELARARPFMFSQLSAWHAGLSQIVIVGRREREDTRVLWDAVARRYLPFVIVLPVEPGDGHDQLAQTLPWIRSMSEVGGRATAYVCRNFACESPVNSEEELDRLLASTAVKA
jgi:uncharacterized protein